ncbi:hypothetical protein LCGC14_2389720, partial [marine sediment metagenome]
RWIDTGGSARRIPTVLGLDAHCVEDYHQPDRTTLIKMTFPKDRALDGIRDALAFADTRIRFPNDLPSPPSPRLVGIVIKGTEGQTFFPDITVAFSENLNCIIGPRGAGKSTLVEALRYVFGYNRTLDDELDPELAKRVRSLQKATLQGATIRVYYKTTDEETLALEATYDVAEDYGTRVYRLDGSDTQIQDVEQSGDFPLRLYGWSEIEMLGREGGRQRAALDRMIPEVLECTLDRDRIRSELAQQLAQIQGKITELQSILREDGGEVQRWAEHKAKFAEYDTDEVRDLFQSLDLAQSKVGVLDKVEENAQAAKTTLQDTLPVNLGDGLDSRLEEDELLRTWWNDGRPEDLDVPAAEQKASEGIRAAIDAMDALRGKLLQAKAAVNIDAVALDEQLRERVSTDAGQEGMVARRQQAKGRLKKASGIRQRYLVKWKELEDLVAGHGGKAIELRGVQVKLSGIRDSALGSIEERLNRFLATKLKIGVAMKREGDRKTFKKKCQEFIGSIDLRNDQKWREVWSAHYAPDQFVDLLLNSKTE